MNCCSKPIAVMIKVGNTETGIIGLNEVFRYVAASGITNETVLKDELVASVRRAGNYIASSREYLYREALFNEYWSFLASIMQTQQE